MTAGNFAWYSLTFPDNVTHEEVTTFMRSLAARGSRPHGWRQPVVLETQHDSRSWQWRLGLPSGARTTVLQMLRTSIPQTRYELIERPASAWVSGAELKLRSPLRPLRTDVSVNASASILAGMSVVRTGESVTLQWLIGPSRRRRPVGNPSTTTKDPWAFVDPMARLDAEGVQALRAKYKEPVLGAVGRVVVEAPGRDRQRRLLARVVGGMQVVREPGVGLIPRLAPGSWVAERATEIATPWMFGGVPLNAAELATVCGWPIGGPAITGVNYATSKMLPAVHGSYVPTTVVNNMTDDERARTRLVGVASHPGSAGYLRLRRTDALRHMLVTGPTGSGKSVLVARLVVSDIASGSPVIVIDPKGDLVDSILEHIPANRVDDVAVLDASDFDSPIGFNPLALHDGQRPEIVADQLLGLLRSLWTESWGPRTNDILHAGLLTLVGQPEASIVSLPTLYTDAAFRRRMIKAALARHPIGLKEFWASFESQSPEWRMQALAPVMSKLRSFQLRPGLRAILGQTEPRYDITNVMHRRGILLVNLASRSVGPDGAALLGSMLVNQIWHATQARGALPADRRPYVGVYIDEFGSFVRSTTDFAEVLTQARGLGVGVVAAHQHLEQLPAALREAALANAQSRVLFRLDSRDARVMAAGHPELEHSDISGLGVYEVYASLVTNGTVTPYASATTMPLGDAISVPATIRARSKAQFGVSAADTDAALTLLMNGPVAKGGTVDNVPFDATASTNGKSASEESSTSLSNAVPDDDGPIGRRRRRP